MPKGGGIVATIKSQMALNDGMSSVLKKITSALDLTLASFEQVQRASGNAVDVANIEAARAGLVDASNAVDEMAENYRRAAQEEEKLNRGIREGTSALDGMVTKAVSLAGAYMSLSAIKGFITDSMESADVQIGAQVQLRTVMGNMGTLDYYDQILDKAAGIQSRGMYGDEAMIAGAGELATYFSDGEAILSMMDTLTNYATGMSNGKALNASTMVDYATGLGKIMSGAYDAMTKKGFEFTDTQKAIIEGTATQAQIVAALGEEYVGLSNDMQAAAVIGNVVNEGWAGLYEAMSNTPEGQVISFNNALGDIQETVGAGIYPAVLNLVQMVQSNLPKINTAAMGVATMLGFLITLLTGMVEGALVFGTAVSDNWNWISPIVMGIVAALAAYAAISAAVAIANGIHAASETTKAAAQAMATGATFAETAAQYGLNTYVYENKTADAVIRMIADDFQLNVGSLEGTGFNIASRVEDNKTLFDIIQTALDETLKATGQMFVLYDDVGKLTLKGLGSMKIDMLVDDSTAGDYDYKSSISSGTHDKIKLSYENKDTGKREIYIAQDGSNINQWGVLQYYEKIDSAGNAKSMADALLNLYNTKTRTLRLKNVLGDVRVRGGTLLVVTLGLGDINLSNYLMVEQVKHTFYNEQHLMDMKMRGGTFVA